MKFKIRYSSLDLLQTGDKSSKYLHENYWPNAGHLQPNQRKELYADDLSMFFLFLLVGIAKVESFQKLFSLKGAEYCLSIVWLCHTIKYQSGNIPYRFTIFIVYNDNTNKYQSIYFLLAT